MMRFLPNRTARIGIDIGHRAVKAVQVNGAGGGRTLAAAASMALRAPGQFDAAEADRLAHLLRRRDFAPAPVAVVAPARAMLSSMLELPPEASGAPIDQIARMEAARIHKQAPDAFEQSHWRLPAAPRVNRAPQALSVILPHAEARSFVGPLSEAGLDVAVVDAWMHAALRACGPLLAAAPAMTAILDLGAHAARVLLGLGPAIASVREVPEAGIDALHQSIAETLAVEPSVAADLLRQQSRDAAPSPEVAQALEAYFTSIEAEVTASCEYAAQQYPDSPVARLLLIGGGGSLLPQLAERLGAALGAPATVVSPARLLTLGLAGCATQPGPALALALGAAQHPEAA